MRERFTDPYERAALEAAAVDLALRQAGTNLRTLLGAASKPVRYVVSFERVADPVARARAEAPGVALKIDADPGWSDDTYAALAALGRVAVLDFKGAGDTERAHRALPQALIEDPGSGSWSEPLARRLSVDSAVPPAPAPDALPARPAAGDLHAPRPAGR